MWRSYRAPPADRVKRIATVVFGLLVRHCQRRGRAVVVQLVCLAQVVSSGISCFFVTHDWVASLSPAAKTPLCASVSLSLALSHVTFVRRYSLLGISLAFALTFCITEALNAELCACASCADPAAPAILASAKQVMILFAGALLMGALYGSPCALFWLWCLTSAAKQASCLAVWTSKKTDRSTRATRLPLFFSLPSVNDDRLVCALVADQSLLLWSIPIGSVIGGVLGVVNEWLRHRHVVGGDVQRQQWSTTGGEEL